MVAPPPPDIRSAGGSGSQQQESAESGVGGVPPATAGTAPSAPDVPTRGPAAATPVSSSATTMEEVPVGGPALAPDAGGILGGASSSVPPPAPEEVEVIFGRRLRSSAEPDMAPIPLPRVLSCAHQALNETEAAIRWEWEALESEHQRLSDWRTQLEERTKEVSCQFVSERSELAWDRKDYKRDLQKVFARELEASQREKRLAKREEALSEREALTTEFRAKLKALD
jgi:hypothetical protein